MDIDQLPDPALIVGADGRIIAANSQAMALFGYAVLEGMGVEELVAGEARARHIEHRQRYNQAPRQRPMSIGGPLAGRKASGERIFVEISLGPLPGGQIIAIIRDATERISREQEFRATRTQLIAVQEEMIQVLKGDITARLRALEERG